MYVIGNIKGVNIILNALPKISVIQDIIVVNLSSLFGIYLSSEFTTKLEGYLALYYTYLLHPFQNNFVKILNEGTKSVHLRKIYRYNYMNDFEKVEYLKRHPLMGSLLTIEILSANDLIYQVIYVGMKNYYLYKNIQPILVFTKNKFEVWIILFDGTRYKLVVKLVLFSNCLRDK